jgi:hypothetical protein
MNLMGYSGPCDRLPILEYRWRDLYKSALQYSATPGIKGGNEGGVSGAATQAVRRLCPSW